MYRRMDGGTYLRQDTYFFCVPRVEFNFSVSFLYLTCLEKKIPLRRTYDIPNSLPLGAFCVPGRVSVNLEFLDHLILTTLYKVGLINIILQMK